MKKAALISIVVLACAAGCTSTPTEVPMDGIYSIEAETISGETIKLKQYEGMTLLIVNTASRCGFTGQYDGLQDLYDQYKDKGFVVLGFPSNDFMGQEPGSNDEIESFCRMNYGVTFPMFGKVSVKGKDQHPLYRYLTSKDTNPEFSGKISWNFNKFLISKEGKVINRFGSRTKPMDRKLVAAIESAIGE